MDLYLNFTRQCNIIEQLWQDFRKATIDPKATPEHLREAERIFKLGCHSMFSTMHGIAGAHSPEQVFIMSHYIDEEIKEFVKQFEVTRIIVQ